MTAQIIPLRKVAKLRGPYRKRSPEQQKRRDDYHRAVGERLRFARAQLGISEEEAAYAFGVTVRTYRRYEAAKLGSWINGLADFTDTFGVSPNWLVGCEGTEAEAPRFRLRAV
jgi:ribosome-binding protein aMBF1 (putative translation factor)